MRLTRMFLRNYRVFEEPLELEVPAGLVGIYGPNGAGKSALLEAIRYCFWGKTRTALDEVRTSGVLADCVAEVEFEHEGHLYLVRRTLSGINSMVRAEARADGAQVAEGARDVGRYVQSVLGMDDAAFRASVFAEQKQVAAFSGQTPAKRRELVLRLLGVTPLDVARDEARKDARVAAGDYERLRTLLPDVTELADALAAAERRAEESDAAVGVAAAAEDEALGRAEEAETRLDELAVLRRAHDDLVAEGREVRAGYEAATATMGRLEAEQAGLADAEARLDGLRDEAGGLARAEERRAQLEVVAAAERALVALPAADPPPPLDEARMEAARAEAERRASEAAGLQGAYGAAAAEVERARAAVARSADLDARGDCPVCGQALGEAVAAVQRHRADEQAGVEARVAELATEVGRATAAAKTAAAEAASSSRALDAGRRAWATFEAALDRRRTVEAALDDATDALGGPPEPGALEAATEEVARRRAAADECLTLEGRLQRRPRVAEELAEATERAREAADRREALLDKVRGLGFRPEALAEAEQARSSARAALDAARSVATGARLAAAAASAERDAARRRAEEGQVAHDRIADLADSSRHLGRLADLLNAFRTNVVATVGPRLAAQAAELFAELTDHEYDRLEVDAESYEIQIRDAGRLHAMERFSGSETDLANLALRVAISEHVRFQSGGAVGLLVLDEVFGPLDEERRERMLQALQRLLGRFRQVLVVTHASDVKDQLPSAIEVVKRPGRRATARVVVGT